PPNYYAPPPPNYYPPPPPVYYAPPPAYTPPPPMVKEPSTGLGLLITGIIFLPLGFGLLGGGIDLLGSNTNCNDAFGGGGGCGNPMAQLSALLQPSLRISSLQVSPAMPPTGHGAPETSVGQLVAVPGGLMASLLRLLGLGKTITLNVSNHRITRIDEGPGTKD